MNTFPNVLTKCVQLFIRHSYTPIRKSTKPDVKKPVITIANKPKHTTSFKKNKTKKVIQLPNCEKQKGKVVHFSPKISRFGPNVRHLAILELELLLIVGWYRRFRTNFDRNKDVKVKSLFFTRSIKVPIRFLRQ